MKNGGPSPQDELTELIGSARSGNRDALNVLLRASRAALQVRAANELPADVRRRVDPSDVIQEVLLEANRDFESFQGRSSEEWRHWLQRVLEHNVVECLRQHIVAERRSVRREFPGEGGKPCVEQFPDADSSPSHRAMRTEAAQRLRDVRSSLEPDHRRILELRYWEDRSLTEIASTMQLSKSGASRLLRSALKELRQRIARQARTDDSL